MSNNDITTKSTRELSDIKNSNLLSENNIDILHSLLPELQHNIQTQTIWRTETEIRVSVLNDKDFPDNASKYHQAKLEQMVFFEQLLYLSLDFKKTKLKLNIIETEIDELNDKLNNCCVDYMKKRISYEIELKEIEKQEVEYRLRDMQIQGNERMREIVIWSKIKTELDTGDFDIDNKDKNQLLSLTKRYVLEAWNAMNSNGSSDIASINNIYAQFNSMVNECINRNIINEVLEYFGQGSSISDWLIRSFNIKI